jgi:hypothetical protein
MSIPRTALLQTSKMQRPLFRVGLHHTTGTKLRDLGDIRRRLFTALLGAVISGLGQNAMAIPNGFGSSCSVFGSAAAETGDGNSTSFNVQSLLPGCGSQVSTTGQVVVNVITDGGPSQFRFDQTADASASATSLMGRLGVRSVSDTTSTPQAYLYQVNGVGAITENRFRATANSVASSYWFDTFTVGGVTSPNGFVILKFSIDLHGQTLASALGARSSLLSRLLLSDGDRYNSDEILSLSNAGILSTTIGFHSFSQFSLMGLLEAQSSAQAGWLGTEYTSASNAAAEALNTSDFYVDVLTPGGTYSSLSGHDYLTPASPVPEPGAVWLLSAGLLVLVGARRKRK